MKPLIVANWKCNPTTIKEAKQLFDSVTEGIKDINGVEVVICPPFIYLPTLFNLSSENLTLGGQNCFWEEKGAFTGKVSVVMLKDLGCEYVIVGHSERRKYFGETDETVHKKLKAVLEAKLNPILCIGESQKERNQGKTETVLRKQLQGALNHLTTKSLNHLIVAYEPIWAIGTGKPCDPEEAQKVSSLIRKIISKVCNSSLSKSIRILYGGSVNSKNAGPFVEKAGLQGLLVGGASLDAKEFVKIIKAVI